MQSPIIYRIAAVLCMPSTMKNSPSSGINTCNREKTPYTSPIQLNAIDTDTIDTDTMDTYTIDTDTIDTDTIETDPIDTDT